MKINRLLKEIGMSSVSALNQAQERSYTIMVIAIVGVFLLSNIPNCMYWIMKDLGLDENFLCFTEFALILYPSANAPIYAVYNKKFREKFFELFCYQSINGSDIPMRELSSKRKTVFTMLPSTNNATVSSASHGYPNLSVGVLPFI